MDTGTESEPYVTEPLESPVPSREPVEAPPERDPQRVDEPVPA
jgi:hypothetical protein